ncbi:MAG TPA: ribosome maturation factor RimP [bacterium]|nr:ribosome maturation factor RimP [bacterium]HOZ20967.1 ribosome maturation factor RimP [bacterium]
MPQVDDLKSLIEPVLAGMGIDLVDLEIQGRKGSTIVRVFADEMGGISLARCVSASRAVSACLDQTNLFDGAYALELSSPGTDRPLTTEKDFQRHCGRKLNLTFRDGEQERRASGQIIAAADGFLQLQTETELLTIPLREVILAKIIIAFK